MQYRPVPSANKIGTGFPTAPELRGQFLPFLTQSSVLHSLESPAYYLWQHRSQISLLLLLGLFYYLGSFHPTSEGRQQLSVHCCRTGLLCDRTQ